MPTRRFEQIALAQLLGAFVFSACVLIDHAQAQPGYVPPPTPLPPPVSIHPVPMSCLNRATDP